MSKQRKPKSSRSDLQGPSHTPHPKILPHKLSFISFQSGYDYGYQWKPEPHRVKNPKWCHLDLDMGQSDSIKDYPVLGKIKSLRLRSLHVSSYHLDSQFIADSINPYFGELDLFKRSGRTLKRLSLEVTFNSKAVPEEVEMIATNKLMVKELPEDLEEYNRIAYAKLKKFVKDQKCLDEFRLYTGSFGNSDWATKMLVYMEKTVKALTLQNLYVNDVFKTYTFPKLEVLRFEHILIDQTEEFFDYSLIVDALDDILALPSLKTLIFTQYQRYNLQSYYYDDYEECDVEKTPKIESDSEFAGIKQMPMKFWELLREKLDKHKDKSLRVLYHMQDEGDREIAKKEKEEADRKFEEEIADKKMKEEKEEENEEEDEEDEEEESGESEDNEDKENKGDEKNKDKRKNQKKTQLKRLKKKKNNSIINKKMDAFKKIFKGLTSGQKFKYEVRIPSFEDQKLPGIRLVMPQGIIENKIYGEFGRVR